MSPVLNMDRSVSSILASTGAIPWPQARSNDEVVRVLVRHNQVPRGYVHA